jgi:hypothetical protein
VVAITRWSKSPRVCSVTQSHSSSSTIERLPSSSTRPARESTKITRVPPRSRQKVQRLPLAVESTLSANSRSSLVAWTLPRTRR